MTERDIDIKVMASLIKVYKEVDQTIQNFGAEILITEAPGIIHRKNTIEDMIKKYAQTHFKGLAYADQMDVDEIEAETIMGTR